VNDAEGDHDIDFTDVEAGNVTVDVSVTDTTAEDSVTISVSDIGDGEVDFENTSSPPIRVTSQTLPSPSRVTRILVTSGLVMQKRSATPRT